MPAPCICPNACTSVRIALKKLRYAREVSAEASGVNMTAELRALKRSQDILGRLHDMQVLLDRVGRLQASLTPPDLTVWRKLDALTLALQNDCRRLHARFMHQRAALLTVCDGAAEVKPPAAGRAAS